MGISHPQLLSLNSLNCSMLFFSFSQLAILGNTQGLTTLHFYGLSPPSLFIFSPFSPLGIFLFVLIIFLLHNWPPMVSGCFRTEPKCKERCMVVWMRSQRAWVQGKNEEVGKGRSCFLTYQAQYKSLGSLPLYHSSRWLKHGRLSINMMPCPCPHRCPWLVLFGLLRGEERYYLQREH